jgi:hypothetical protein
MTTPDVTRETTTHAAAPRLAERAAAPPAGEHVADVLVGLVRHPSRLVRLWNWKSAIMSSWFRATVFFFANVSAGWGAAFAAMLTELSFRGLTAGFYGALTQSFCAAEPRWLATLTTMVVLPIATHVTEYFVHWLRGTARLERSIMLSVFFTVVSTLFNLYAMRRGALIVGEGRNTLWHDLRRMPRLILAFIALPVAWLRTRNEWLSRRFT